MLKQLRIFAVLSISILLCLAAIQTFAATVSYSGSLTTGDSHFGSGELPIRCSGLGGTGSYYDQIVFYVTETGSYTVTINGSWGESLISIFSPSFSPGSISGCVVADLDDGTVDNSVTATLQANTRYVLFILTNPVDATGTYTGSITGPGDICLNAPCGTAAVVDDSPQRVFFDERINDFDTGNSVVLYGKPNGDDEWRLEVYNADASGMLFVVYPDAIAAVPECPDSNTLIYSDAATGISLWRLPQRTVTAEGFSVCPFQLNAPSTEAGKTYIIIFDTLYPSTYYESWDEWIGN